MRRRLTVVLFVLSLIGLVVVSDDFTFAQQPEAAGRRKIMNRVTPIYPDLARRMHLTGTVRVQVTVAPNGTVKFTEVVGGSPLLAQAALGAVQKWKWQADSEETKELIEFRFDPN